jgi:LPXTG-motif cell wall-anchored protein
VQRIYYCHDCQKETERTVHKCGRATRPLRGWSWLNNDRVNLLASLAGGLLAAGLWALFRRRKRVS